MGIPGAAKRNERRGTHRSKRAATKLAPRTTTRHPSLSDVLDAADRLDHEAQTELVAILARRIAERGRKRVIADVKQARQEFAKGEYESKTATEIVREALS